MEEEDQVNISNVLIRQMPLVIFVCELSQRVSSKTPDTSLDMITVILAI